jgi:uncharacterized protein HemX
MAGRQNSPSEAKGSQVTEQPKITNGRLCPVGIKNTSKITAVQWLLGILITSVMGGALLAATVINGVQQETANLNRRITLAEDRYDRSQQDFAEIKKLLRELSNKIDELHRR